MGQLITRAALLSILLITLARAGDVYVRRAGDEITFGADKVERTVALRQGKFLLTRLRDKLTGNELLPENTAIEEFQLLVGTDRTPLAGSTGGWRLTEAKESPLAEGARRLDVVLDRPSLRITRTCVLYPNSSIIRECMTIANTGDAPLPIADPTFLLLTFAGEPAKLDFHWMTGAHNIPGCWQLKTEQLRAGAPRQFDSYDPYPHGPPNQPRSFKPGSASYAPWYAFYSRGSQQGLFIGFDYFGHWASRFEVVADKVQTRLSLADFRRTLKPGESITTPWALVGLFSRDLDNAGNELLDWQYAHLWDYTRDGRNGTYPWFPSLRHLGYWSKGTGWGKPGVGWTGGNPDLRSTYLKVFRIADFMRYTGADVYHRDWGWWDLAGDWNGPDFRSTGDYLRKHEMGQLIYAFLYTVSRKSRVAREHPEWLARSDDDGMTLDLSRPDVVAFVRGQLDSFVQRWGDFGWRNDSTITGQRDSDPSTLLEQDQNFRELLRAFLDKYPNCGFQAVNGGGNFAGYDYVRYACNVQFSDGVIGPLRNYHSALLFPPDKNCDNPDQWDVAKFDKASWRGLLCFNYDTTGDTTDPARLEGLRELADIYHYLQSQGVVGRWVKVYRPQITGDDPTMWFQRLSRDRQRGIVIPKHVPKGQVTIRPKGLLPEHMYLVSFQESPDSEKRSGKDLMEKGLILAKLPPGELIYLNLPMHPGNKFDVEPPAPPEPITAKPAENMGFPGIELTWKPGRDDQWLSHYQVFRNGAMIDKVAKGRFYFDHSAGADAHAKYELCSVDGAGNVSEKAAFRQAEGPAARVIDEGDERTIKRTGSWQQVAEPAAHAGMLSVAREKGAAMELEFEGKRILLFGSLGADRGKLNIRIDDGQVMTVDTFAADDIYGACLWRMELAKAGRHTLRIEVSGERNPLSSGQAARIDGIRVERE